MIPNVRLPFGKRHTGLALLALLVSTLHPRLSTAYAQGSLTPPGPPDATMKTLDQIEARTPIASAPFTITQPGSYYLTANLTVSSGNAVTIATNGVTLDLNGFTLASTANPPGGNGIRLNSQSSGISIVNGHIRGGVTNNAGVYGGRGFGNGISYASIEPRNVLVSRVTISGCLDSGINLGIGNATVVESCTVQTVGGYGILAATVKGSIAVDCGGTAVYCVNVVDCRAESSGSGYGISASTATGCYASSAGTHGLYAIVVQNCYGVAGGIGVGLSAYTAQNCFGHSTSGNGYGLYAITAQNSYGYSTNSTGLHATRTAIGCFGQSTTGTGLYTTVANACIGFRPGGTAIQATVANGCYPASGTNLVTFKYNMP